MRKMLKFPQISARRAVIGAMIWAAMVIVGGSALSGCSKKEPLPFTAVHVTVPKLVDDPVTAPVVTRSQGQVNEGLTINSSKISVPQKYIAWFTKQGWKTTMNNDAVNSMDVQMEKDGAKVQITYTPSRGTYMMISEPEGGTQK